MKQGQLDDEARRAGFIDSIARREYFLVAIATLSFSTSAAHASLMALAFERTGYDLSAIGVLLSSLAVTTMTFTLASGWIMTRIGSLASLRIAMLTTGLGIISLAWTIDSYVAALGSRLIWGIGVGLFLPCSMVYLQSRLNPTRFVYLITVFSAMVPIAQAIAPSIGEFVLTHFGPRIMLIEGSAWVLCGLLLTLQLRPLPKPTASGRLDFRSSLQRRYLLPISGLLAGGTVFGYAFAYIAPALEQRGISLSWFFIASTGAMIFGRVGISKYITALQPPVIAGAGLLFSCASLALAAFATHPLVAALAGASLGIGNSVMYPVLSSWMSYGLGPTQRAGVQSLAATAFYFGIYAAPFPQARLIAIIGYANTQLWLAAACSIVGFVMIFAGRTRND